MTDREIVKATERMAVEFQNAAANAYLDASMWIDGRDRYFPRMPILLTPTHTHASILSLKRG